jgi:lipoprotein-anchoring transpeptidase ErfK/SrfK
MRFLLAASVFALSIVSATSASARVDVEVDVSTQTMRVRMGKATYAWPVSTARGGYFTPRGRYYPTLLKRIHYSRKYHMSPMPHSIFFNGGYAIHGTYETSFLGRPASHGCIRLAPRHAAQLYDMIEREGAAITIVDMASRSSAYQKTSRKSQSISSRPSHDFFAEPTSSDYE